MAFEPDNKMEELLKTYAKKRQDEAGAPFELHPATRKLLQSEVARLRPPATVPASWLGLMIRFWPRLGFAASILAVFLGVVWMVNQGGDQTRRLAKSLPASESEFLASPTPLARNPDRNEAARARGAVSISAPPTASPAPANLPAIQLSMDEPRLTGAVGKTESLKDGSQLTLAFQESEKTLRADKKTVSEPSQVTRSPSDEFSRNAPSPSAPAAMSPEMVSRSLSEKKGAVVDAQNRGLSTDTSPQLSEMPSSSARVAGTPTSSTASGNVQKELGPLTGGKAGGFGGKKEEQDFGANAAGVRVAKRSSKMDADGATVKLETANQKPSSGAPTTFGGGGGFAERLYDLPSMAPQGGSSNATSFGYALPPSGPSQSQGKFLADQKTVHDSFGKGLSYVRSEKNMETDGLKLQSLEGSERRIQLGVGVSDEKRPAADNVTSLTKSKAATSQPVDAAKTSAIVADADKTVTLAAKVEPANKPQATRGDSYFSDVIGKSDSTSRWYFQTQPLAAVTDRFRKLNAPAKQNPEDPEGAVASVLSQFSLEQQGDRIRIIDADGSVYEGQAVTASNGRRAGNVDKASRSKIAAAEDRPAPAGPVQNNLSFRVSGTSRSLNQPVVINGTLVSDSSVAANSLADNSSAEVLARSATEPAPATPRPVRPSVSEKSKAEVLGRKNRADAPITSPVLPTMRIQGKVRVGDSTEIEINAVRVKP